MIAVGFCFTDRDFVTASSPITSFSFSEKEKEGKRKAAQGAAPRSEPRFTPADRDEVKTGAQCGSAPRDPRGTGKPGAVTDRGNVHSGESFGIRAKTARLSNRAARPLLWLPLRGLRSRGAAMNRSPGRPRTAPDRAAARQLRPQAVMRCSATARY